MLIDGEDVKRGRDGDEKLRLMVRSIGHTLEMLGLGAATIAGAAGTVLSGATGAGAVVGGALTLGAAALTAKQAQYVRDLRSLNKLIQIIDQYAELKPKINTNRSQLRKLWDFMMRKTPEQIEDEAEKKVRRAARKAQMKMEKMLRGFPKYIEYYDEEGEKDEYPIIQLFDNL